jgi:hypothetical protein
MPLTPTQHLLLSRAAQHADHLITPPETMSPRSFQTSTAHLLRLGLAEPVTPKRRSRGGTEEPGGGLRITAAGLHALGPADGATLMPSATKPEALKASAAPKSRARRKRALLLERLGQEHGASLAELVTAMGWLPHTTWATLSRLRGAGHPITRCKREDGTSAYRISITNSPADAAPATSAAQEAC